MHSRKWPKGALFKATASPGHPVHGVSGQGPPGKSRGQLYLLGPPTPYSLGPPGPPLRHGRRAISSS